MNIIKYHHVQNLCPSVQEQKANGQNKRFSLTWTGVECILKTSFYPIL